ncbi:glutathione S-transferase [Rhizobiales bacterium GAS113]|nr:glutathione S-transferase [Rhizobiales bacterium GAS113]SED85142.1 glutathione S-transferase [Rhizobiales bacterium GAS188]
MFLYYAPNACSLVVHIALEEAAATYELFRVDFANKGQRAPEFLAKNPLGRVPVLETEHGLLTEVPAILTYISLNYPDAKLGTFDPYMAARLASFQAFLSSTVHVTFAHYFRPERWADDECARKAISLKAVNTYAQNFRMIEEHWFVGPWVMGDHFTTADPYLYLMARWLSRIGLSVSSFPRIEQHLRQMSARPSVIRTLKQEELEQ